MKSSLVAASTFAALALTVACGTEPIKAPEPAPAPTYQFAGEYSVCPALENADPNCVYDVHTMTLTDPANDGNFRLVTSPDRAADVRGAPGQMANDTTLKVVDSATYNYSGCSVGMVSTWTLELDVSGNLTGTLRRVPQGSSCTSIATPPICVYLVKAVRR